MILKGDYVMKKGGNLAYEGIVLSVYNDLYGIEHADVQVPGIKGITPYAGMIHLYPTSVLEKHDYPKRVKDWRASL